MNVAILTNDNDWDTLEPHWNALLQRSSSPSIFLSWEWIKPWWQSFKKPADTLCVLAAWDGDKLVGAGPLYRSQMGMLGFKDPQRLGLIGDTSGDSEYLDFIIEKGRETEIMGAFIETIEQQAPTWHVAEFALMPKTSPNLDILIRHAQKKRYLVELRDTQCMAVTLPGTWEDYLKTLQSRFRTKVRSLLRRLPTEHDCVFQRLADPNDLSKHLESLFELHQQRWRTQDEPGAFSSAARRQFYFKMANGFHHQGWLRFYTMQVRGKPIAYEFSFEYLGKVSYLQQGFDPSYGKLSVGTALKAYVIRDCIAEGARIYDFLGGDDPFKTKWGTTPTYCTHLSLARPTPGAYLYWWLPRFIKKIKTYARGKTPVGLLELKRSIQARLKKRRARP